MKRCPECRKDYFDDSLLFCLDDGAGLVQGSLTDEPVTAMLGYDTAEPPTKIRTNAVFDDASGSRADRTTKRGQIVPAIVGVIAVVALAVGGYMYYASAGSGGQIRSIAVMPFENHSGSSDAEYLSDGLTDSLIFRFAQLPNIKVSPTSSVMRYKGTTKDVAAIAKELDVNAVLTGRLSQIGDSLSVSVQLIDARTGKLVWAEQYDRRMADLLATQREIATTLTQKMQLRLVGDEVGIAKKYTDNNEAYQLYLKGRYHWSRRGLDDLLKSIESYKKAIELDPNFALAHAGIAEAYNSLAKNPHLAPRDAVPYAKAAATRALEIDPNLAQAHSALADSLTIYDWDWKAADEHFKKAIELDPNISYTHLAYGGSYLSAVGKADEALQHEQRAVELEPLSLINNAVLVSGYLNARQPEKALAQARAAHDLDPSFPFSHHWLGFALVANGKSEEAITVCRQIAPEPSSAWLSTVVLAHAYARLGNRAEAEKSIAELKELGKKVYVRSYYIASVYATLGDKDKAFAELERSYEEKDCYLGRMAVDPFLDPLRDDPRFSQLVKRMRLPQYDR